MQDFIKDISLGRKKFQSLLQYTTSIVLRVWGYTYSPCRDFRFFLDILGPNISAAIKAMYEAMEFVICFH